MKDLSAWRENKWTRAAIPALLIHVSIGTVYCWSSFKADIAETIGAPVPQVEWAFSLAIFFLGMSAAFGGRFVERNIKKSALISMGFFVTGFLGTGISVQLHSLAGVYICYGVLMGIGLGIGYLTPVKNLMLWFQESKGLGTGLAVAGFGLAKVIASPAMEWLIGQAGLVQMFFALAGVYAAMMFGGFLLIKRPPSYQADRQPAPIKPLSLLKKPVFIGIWIMFYLNITCGLALISQEKDILKLVLPNLGIEPAAIAGIIATVLAADAAFNTFGRLGFSTLSDRFRKRETSYKILFLMSAGVCLLVLFTGGIEKSLLPAVLAMLFLVNAGYGGGFSTLPVLLQQHFGMKTISTVHGLALSAWAFAGLSGNQLAAYIVHDLGLGYQTVVLVICTLYIIAFAICLAVASAGKERTRH